MPYLIRTAAAWRMQNVTADLLPFLLLLDPKTHVFTAWAVHLPTQLLAFCQNILLLPPIGFHPVREIYTGLMTPRTQRGKYRSIGCFCLKRTVAGINMCSDVWASGVRFQVRGLCDEWGCSVTVWSFHDVFSHLINIPNSQLLHWFCSLYRLKLVFYIFNWLTVSVSDQQRKNGGLLNLLVWAKTQKTLPAWRKLRAKFLLFNLLSWFKKPGSQRFDV